MKDHDLNTCSICSNSSLSLALGVFQKYPRVNSFHLCLPPVSQIGPSCGIAALSSALHCVNRSAVADQCSYNFENLLSLAKTENISHNGELFDAESVVKLTNISCSNVAAEVVKLDEDVFKAKNQLLHWLTKGSPVLIAYDCDADFYPKLASGHKSHWAVLNGFCYGDSLQCFSWKQSTMLVNLSQETELRIATEAASKAKQELVFFWALQGKSRLFRLFDGAALLHSNFQLKEPDPKLSPDNYKLPSDNNLNDTLAYRVVVFSKLS